MSGTASKNGVTGLLAAWGHGDASADERLMVAVYNDLRGVARRRLRAERPDHSLVPTALVHEAYMRLVTLRRVRWQNRAHFFAIAARMMRLCWSTMHACAPPRNGTAPHGRWR
jgi:RNA polymerase sigma factor (TIGR02999 family)